MGVFLPRPAPLLVVLGLLAPHVLAEVADKVWFA